MTERATHLLSWLEQAYTHCQHGSQEWCEGYLHNAKDVIEAQDEEISKLRAALSRIARMQGTAGSEEDPRAKGYMIENGVRREIVIRQGVFASSVARDALNQIQTHAAGAER